MCGRDGASLVQLPCAIDLVESDWLEQPCRLPVKDAGTRRFFKLTSNNKLWCFTVDEPDATPADLRPLRPGPIRHPSLPPDLLKKIHAIYEVLGPYLDTTSEQFETGFKRDAHPADEVAVWCYITVAWIEYHEQHLGSEYLPDEEEKKLVAALIAISTGVRDATALKLPPDVATQLLECYDAVTEE